MDRRSVRRVLRVMGMVVAGGALAAGGALLARAATGPTASFSYSPTSPAVGAVVSFSNASQTDPTRTGPNESLKYAWDFGDNSPVTGDTDPSHVFTAATVYTVTLGVVEYVGSDA